MDLVCGNGQINIRSNGSSSIVHVEKAYLKQFDGATVKFVEGPEGDKLVISIRE